MFTKLKLHPLQNLSYYPRVLRFMSVSPYTPFSQTLSELTHFSAFFFKEEIFLDYFVDAFSIYENKNKRRQRKRIHVTARKFRKMKTTFEEEQQKV